MNRRNIIAGSRTVRLIRTPDALIYRAVLCCIFAVSLSIIHETQIPFTFFEIFWKSLKIGWFYVILYLLGRSSLSGREVIESMFAFVLNFALSIAASVIAYYICKWLDEQFFKPSKHWSISTETPSVLQYRGRFCFAPWRWIHGRKFLTSHLYYMRCLVKCQQFRTKLSAMPRASLLFALLAQSLPLEGKVARSAGWGGNLAAEVVLGADRRKDRKVNLMPRAPPSGELASEARLRGWARPPA